jgi:NAD(P)-dependent dehydrogenase (short-subunit alcohol dehydrogenase family)
MNEEPSMKNVLITGGSRGLGFELGRVLGKRGAKVVLVARHAPEVEAAASILRSEGIEAHAIAADVGDKGAIHAIAGQAAALVGPIEVLIHNASTLGPTPLRLLLDTECEDLEAVLEVNLVGPFRLTKAIAGHMALLGRGTVVHISSDAAIEAYPRWGAYSVSKAALDHLNRLWAAELGEAGVRFLAIDPGEMRTRMHADAIPDADPSTLADPALIAGRIAAMLSRSEGRTNGLRARATGEWS